MEVLKGVTTNDVIHAIPRNNWKAGNVYYQYNDLATSSNLFDSQFVVINSEYNVYKCLSNGSGNLTINEPTGTGATGNNLIFNSSLGQDGYVWKYMYNIPVGTWVKFGTQSFIPIVETTAQVKTDAANCKGIYAYNIVSANVGSTSPPDGVHTVTIVGDGTGATACVKIVNGNISNVIVNSYGNFYTVANVSTNLGNAAIEPIIAPPDGHGYSSIDECGGVFAMVNVRFDAGDYPLVPIDGFKFRQVGLIKDPYLYGTTVVPTITTANSLLSAYSNVEIVSTITNSSQLNAGVVLKGGTSGANATVVSYLGNVINYVKSRDTSSNIEANFKSFQPGETLFVDTFAIGTVATLGNSTVHPKSGEIIYIDNRNVITRATDQVEDVFIVLEF